MKKADRCLNYVKNRAKLALVYPVSNSVSKKCNIRVYVDSSFANAEKRRSVYGYVVFVNGQVAHWRSKVTPMVCLSVTEAEFVAVALTLRDIKWIYSILCELYFQIEHSVIYTDNQGALKIMKAETSTARTRHLDVKLQFSKEIFASGDYELRFVQSSDNVADVFTKGLFRLNFERLVGKLMVELP